MPKYSPLIFGVFSSILAVSVANADSITIDNYIAVASTNNYAKSNNNFSNAAGIHIRGVWNYLASAVTSGSFNDSSGIALGSQNAGANSILQNAISVAYIASCSTCLQTGARGFALTTGVATNTASVLHNLDYPGYGLSYSSSGGGGNGGGSSSSSGGGGNGGGSSAGGAAPGDHGLIPQGSDPFSTITSSFNYNNGIVSVNQNSGNNSVLQSAISVGSVNVHSLFGSTVNSSSSTNKGLSSGNVSYSLDAPTSSQTLSSFNGSRGILSSAQNTGSNSLLQNSAVVTETNTTVVPDKIMAITAAKSENSADLWNDTSVSQLQNNSSGIYNSFNSAVGLLMSGQNSGSNSLLQNSVTVASFRNN